MLSLTAFTVSAQETFKKSEKSVSAANVISDYLNAIGGKEELKKLNSTKTTFTMSTMGTNFEGTSIKMAPNKEYTELKMGEIIGAQYSFDGSKGFKSQIQGDGSLMRTEMDEKEIKDAQDEKVFIPQLYYISNEHQISYLGMDKVGDEDAYKIKIIKPSGKVTIEYYSVKTKLLLRNENTKIKGGNETTDIKYFSDYKKVGNVILPYTITRTFGEQEFAISISEIKINEGVTDADFKQD